MATLEQLDRLAAKRVRDERGKETERRAAQRLVWSVDVGESETHHFGPGRSCVDAVVGLSRQLVRSIDVGWIERMLLVD